MKLTAVLILMSRTEGGCYAKTIQFKTEEAAAACVALCSMNNHYAQVIQIPGDDQ